MKNDIDLITLQIETESIQCNRQDLIENSDYFRAMFDGNFLESKKDIVTLNEVTVEAMNNLLKILWEKETANVLSEDQLLSVLEVASMLQFLGIQEQIVLKLLRELSVGNCLKFWFFTEPLGIKDLCLKSKLLALMEFDLVKDTEQFIELNLKEVCMYLGNRCLRSGNEIIVYESIMKWYRNSLDQGSDILVKLLHCLDYENLNISDEDHLEILKTIRENCGKAKCRNQSGFPCFLVEKVGGTENKLIVLHYDRFKRKRKYDLLDDDSNYDASLIFIDPYSFSLRKLVDFSMKNLLNLYGFKVISHRQYIYVFGGEYFLGMGNWNRSFMIYNTVTESWKQHKSELPFKRRHFECCICNDTLYVIGGTGPFRDIQSNMFWYDTKKDRWSDELLKLPSIDRQIKCCSFNNHLFVLYINNKCGAFFNHSDKNWSWVVIADNGHDLPHFSHTMTLFAYNSKLYIKEQKLTALKLLDGRFFVESVRDTPEGECNQKEAVLCNEILYSVMVDRNKFTFERFNLDTGEGEVIAKVERNLEIGGEHFQFMSYSNIFGAFHWDFVENDEFVNENLAQIL